MPKEMVVEIGAVVTTPQLELRSIAPHPSSVPVLSNALHCRVGCAILPAVARSSRWP
jgi:hypothetical protein